MPLLFSLLPYVLIALAVVEWRLLLALLNVPKYRTMCPVVGEVVARWGPFALLVLGPLAWALLGIAITALTGVWFPVFALVVRLSFTAFWLWIVGRDLRLLRA